MVGEKLMSILYKGYSVPETQGKSRYVDMGMSFKKNEEKSKAKYTPRTETRRNSGELIEAVYAAVLPRWQGAPEIATKVDAGVDSIRKVLDKLTMLGRIECNGIKRFKQYRRKA